MLESFHFIVSFINFLNDHIFSTTLYKIMQLEINLMELKRRYSLKKL